MGAAVRGARRRQGDTAARRNVAGRINQRARAAASDAPPPLLLPPHPGPPLGAAAAAKYVRHARPSGLARRAGGVTATGTGGRAGSLLRLSGNSRRLMESQARSGDYFTRPTMRYPMIGRLSATSGQFRRGRSRSCAQAPVIPVFAHRLPAEY